MGEKSSSGEIVSVESVVLENKNLAEDRMLVREHAVPPCEYAVVRVPAGHIVGGVDSATYDGYRKGLDSACADIVITTIKPDGQAAVISTKRAKNKMLGGFWWVQGGAMHSYRNLTDFLKDRAEAECGVQPTIEAVIGVYRTAAEDLLGCTTNVCYVGSVEYGELMSQVKFDADHSAWKILTLSDIKGLPSEECHWYPMRVFRMALNTMP